MARIYAPGRRTSWTNHPTSSKDSPISHSSALTSAILTPTSSTWQDTDTCEEGMAKRLQPQAVCSPSDTTEYNLKLATAYSALGLTIGSNVSDEVVIAKFGAGAVTQGYHNKDFLKQLAMVGEHRSSEEIARFVKYQAYQTALYDLWVTEGAPDDVVKDVFDNSFGHPLTIGNEELRDAITIVAEYRNSLMLQKFAAGQSTCDTTIEDGLPAQFRASTDCWSKSIVEEANHSDLMTTGVDELGDDENGSFEYSEQDGESAARDDWDDMYGKPHEAPGTFSKNLIRVILCSWIEDNSEFYVPKFLMERLLSHESYNQKRLSLCSSKPTVLAHEDSATFPQLLHYLGALESGLKLTVGLGNRPTNVVALYSMASSFRLEEVTDTLLGVFESITCLAELLVAAKSLHLKASADDKFRQSFRLRVEQLLGQSHKWHESCTFSKDGELHPCVENVEHQFSDMSHNPLLCQDIMGILAKREISWMIDKGKFNKADSFEGEDTEDHHKDEQVDRTVDAHTGSNAGIETNPLTSEATGVGNDNNNNNAEYLASQFNKLSGDGNRDMSNAAPDTQAHQQDHASAPVPPSSQRLAFDLPPQSSFDVIAIKDSNDQDCGLTFRVGDVIHNVFGVPIAPRRTVHSPNLELFLGGTRNGICGAFPLSYVKFVDPYDWSVSETAQGTADDEWASEDRGW